MVENGFLVATVFVIVLVPCLQKNLFLAKAEIGHKDLKPEILKEKIPVFKNEIFDVCVAENDLHRRRSLLAVVVLRTTADDYDGLLFKLCTASSDY